MSPRQLKIYCGRILNPRRTGAVDYINKGALAVDVKGVLQFVGLASEARRRFPQSRFHDFGAALLLPGFVDTHVHLPQYRARGIWSGELLQWLEQVIFPMEARFADPEHARRESEVFFRAALAQGTTSMSVFCSSQRRATDEAFEAARSSGLRVCMGKSIMERGAPAELLSSAEQNIDDSLALAERWHGVDDGRLQYTITPRYAGSCSMALLRRCGELARREGLRLQTHLAENPGELAYIKSLFPAASSYTAVYESAGMLQEHAIMAHAIHLGESELTMLKDSGTAIAHCPCSNRFLQSGIMPLRRYLDRGLQVGLGSDVAGGFSLSMRNEQREAIEGSKSYNILNRNAQQAVLRCEEAFWLATLGGAIALGLDDRVGSFRSGKEADFVVWSVPDGCSSEDGHSAEELLAGLLYHEEANTIHSVYVSGRELFAA